MRAKWFLYLVILISLITNKSGVSQVASEVSISILSPPNMTGVNSETYLEKFRHGESINLEDGRITLSAPGPVIDFSQGSIDIHPQLTPHLSHFRNEKILVSSFEDEDNSNIYPKVYTLPSDQPIGPFGRFISTHSGSTSRSEMLLSGNWQFSFNGLLGVIEVSLQNNGSAYYVFHEDGSIEYIDVFPNSAQRQKEHGFRRRYNYARLDSSRFSIQDVEGNTYIFDNTDGLNHEPSYPGMITSEFQGEVCHTAWALFIPIHVCDYFPLPGWRVKPYYLQSYQDKFGNVTSVGARRSVAGYDYVREITTPKMILGYLKRGSQVLIKTNFDLNHPDDDSDRRVWSYEYDDARRITQVQDALRNHTQISYELSSTPITVRRLGALFPSDPEEVIEMTYPTGALFRYESFGTDVGDVRGAIVTEFPDKNDSSIFYQKYVVAPDVDRTEVFDMDGTQTTYSFMDQDGLHLLSSKVKSFSGSNETEVYHWETRSIPDSNPPASFAVGLTRISNTIQGVTVDVNREYDDVGRLSQQTIPALGQRTSYTYFPGSSPSEPVDHVQRISQDLTVLDDHGTSQIQTRVVHFYPFDPVICGVAPATTHIASRAFILGRWTVSDGTNPEITMQNFCYDAFGNMTREVNGSGYGITHSYVAAEHSEAVSRTPFPPSYRSRSVTDPVNGQQEISSYNYDLSTTQLSEQTDPQGLVSNFSYDSLGRQLSETFSTGSSLEYQYYLSNGVDTIDSPSLREKNAIVQSALAGSTVLSQKTKIFDGLGLITEDIDALGRRTIYNYDAGKRVNQITLADGRIWRFIYDGFGKLLQGINPGAQIVNNTYGREQITHFGQPNFPTDTISYFVADRLQLKKYFDYEGHLVRLERGLGSEREILNYQYDQTGNLIRETSGAGFSVIHRYDPYSRFVKRLYPDNTRFEVLSYTNHFKAGQTQLVGDDGSHILQQTTYDAKDRILSISDERGLSQTFAYDENETGQNGLGHLTSVTDTTGSTHYSYDLGGHITKVSSRILSGTPQEFHYSYDGYGSLTSQGYPNGQSFFVQRDASGNVTEVRQSDSSGAVLERLSYTPSGKLQDLTLGNGLRQSYQYDLGGRIQQMTVTKAGTTIQQESYVYDVLGNKIEIQRLDGSRVHYSYDSLKRIVSTEYYKAHDSVPFQTQSYSYDLDGHRKTYQDGLKNYIYQLDAGHAGRVAQISTMDTDGRAIVGGRDVLISYDPFGNIVRKQERLKNRVVRTLDFQYDSKARLVDFSISDSLGHINTHTTYAYDFKDRRVSKTVNGQITYYLYGQQNTPALEIDADGSVLASHVSVNGHHVATIKNGEIYYYLADELENVRWVSDSQGNEVSTLLYDPFGNTNFEAGSFDTRYRFEGHEQDLESGLIYFGARYYDPELGQFLTKDPAESSMNPYLFANNNPVSTRDIEGLYPDYYNGGTVSCYYDASSEACQGSSGSGSGGIDVGFYNDPFGGDPFGYSGGSYGGYEQPYQPGEYTNGTDGDNFWDPMDYSGGTHTPLRETPRNFHEMPLPTEIDKTVQTSNPVSSHFNPMQSGVDSLPREIGTQLAYNLPSQESMTVSQSNTLQPITPVRSVDYTRATSNFTGSSSGTSTQVPTDLFGVPTEVSQVNYSQAQDNPSPAAQETYGDAQNVSHNHLNDSGDPVMLNDGDLFQVQTDMKIPGIGIDYEFTRTYRSRILFDGPMGFNWDHSYNKRLIEQRNSAGDLSGILRFDGKARVDFYAYNTSTHSFTTPSGLFDELTKNPDGTYVIRDRYGIISNYDVEGFVTAITDRNNNRLAFTYITIGTNKRLDQVTDTLGRVIRYQYRTSGLGTGLLFKVTDFSGREVVFTYDEHRDLVSVRSPMSVDAPSGKTVSYLYSSGYTVDRNEMNHNLLRVIDAKGQTYLENIYSIEDRVVRQRLGDEGTFTFSYQQIATPSSCSPLLLDAVVYKTTVTDRVGNLTNWEFNCQGNPLTKTENTRGVRSDDPRSYVTHYRYNQHGLVTDITQPQGNQVHYRYSFGAGISRLSEGNIVEIVKEKDSGRSGGNPIRIVMSYEPVYNQLQSIIDPRGNDSSFVPSNGGVATPSRYTSVRYFDDHGNVVRSVQPLSETRFHYNSSGQVTRVENPSGAIDTYDYFSSGPQRGYLRALTKDSGHENVTNQFTYDAVGNPLTFTDGRDQVFTYEVNALNQILRETSPIGHEKRYSYDANNNLVSVEVQNKDASGALSSTQPWIRIDFAYNSLDRLVSKTEDVSPSKRIVTEYQYDLNENLVRVIEPEGNSIKIDYDERDLPARLIRGFESSEATTFLLKYDANRNLKTMRDGGGHDWNYDYDGFDRLVRTVSPTLDQTLVAYDPSGDVSSISKRGPPRWTGLEVLLAEEHLIHDEQHRLLVNQKTLLNESFARVRDVVTQFQYDAQSRLIQLQDDNNHVSRFGYDGLNRLIQFTDALGNQISNTYDAANNLTRRRSHEVAASRFDDFENNYRYDSLNRLIRMTDTLGQTSTYSYDSRSNLTATSDPKENVSHYTYDALNRRVRSSLELRNNGVGSGALLGTINTDYEYDDNSRLIRMTDDNHHATTFDYDHLNRKVRTHLADSSVYRYTYDTNDNLSRYEDPKGFQIDLHYDAAHRLTVKDITQDHTSQGREVMAYDGLSRLVRASVEDETGATSSDVQFHYDSLNRILRETQDGHDVVSAYDGVGNQTDLTYPSGRVIHQAFDVINRLTSIQNDLSADILTQTHVGIGRLATRHFENGTTTTWSYDAVKRMASVNHMDGASRILAGFNYGYDRVSNRLFEADLQDSGRTRVHRYDSVQRLLETRYGISDPEAEVATPGSQIATQAESWNLDGANNWTSHVTDPTPAVPGDEVTQSFVPSVVNTYSSVAGTTYLYDRNGNLTDNDQFLYTYDYRNLITEVRRKSDRVVVATYRYDALGRRIEKTVSGAITHYFYKGAQVLEEHDASGALQAQYLYGEGVDDVVSMERGGHTYHYHADSLGNIVAVSDESGVVVERYHYDAYGSVSISDGSGAPLTHTAIGNSFLFNGHTFDAETGLYYYRARYYDPNIGRFLQRDPMGFIDGVNVYAYTRNNPINGLDPFGFNTTSSQGNSAAGNPYGNPWGQNSWLGTLTGKPVMTYTGMGADVFQNLNLHVGNSYIDPTLGLINDVFNISGNMANGVLGGLAHGVGFVDEMLAKTGCDLQCIAITEQASGIPLGKALSGMTQGIRAIIPVRSIQVVNVLSEGAKGEEAFLYYMKQVETLNVSTARNSAVFYSGPGNRALAEEFAMSNGKTTLEMTSGGKWLDQQQLFGPNSPLTKDQAYQVWSKLSERYAQEASGTATGFVNGSRSNSIFNTTEYNALQKNPNVVNVITGGH